MSLQRRNVLEPLEYEEGAGIIAIAIQKVHNAAWLLASGGHAWLEGILKRLLTAGFDFELHGHAERLALVGHLRLHQRDNRILFLGLQRRKSAQQNQQNDE